MQTRKEKDPQKFRGTRTCIFKHGAIKEFDIQRFPAILCTNHQIYDEASRFFFSTLEIHLAPTYVLSMALNSTGIAVTPGSNLNPMLKLDSVMNPDALALFKKITFDIDFSFQSASQMEALEAELSPRTRNDDTSLLSNTMPRLFIDENVTVNPDDAAKLLTFYRRSNLIHHFVDIVSNSPRLTRLVITLHASVFVDYDSDSDSDSDPSMYDVGSDPGMGPDFNGDADELESTLKYDLMTGVANERATELLLDSGLLAPLEKLSNVQSFQFAFKTLDRNRELYKPTAKHLELLVDLKRKIERNYIVRTG